MSDSSQPPPDPKAFPTGPLIVGLGVVLIVVGLLVWSGALSWFGRLPGDIRHEGSSTRLYVPWVSMLVVSIGLSVLAALLRKLF